MSDTLPGRARGVSSLEYGSGVWSFRIRACLWGLELRALSFVLGLEFIALRFGLRFGASGCEVGSGLEFSALVALGI